QGRGFIEEEEFGVVARRHHRPFPALECQQAHDPALDLPGPPDAALLVVQDAPVAHERAPLRDDDDLAERGDTILPRHPQPPTRLTLYPSSSSSATMRSRWSP